MAGGVPRLYRRHTPHQCLIGDVDQALGAPRNMSYRVHAAGVPVPAIEDEGDIDVDDVPLLQWFRVGDPVADNMVDRGAGCLGKAAIVAGRDRKSTRLNSSHLGTS